MELLVENAATLGTSEYYRCPSPGEGRARDQYGVLDLRFGLRALLGRRDTKQESRQSGAMKDELTTSCGDDAAAEAAGKPRPPPVVPTREEGAAD